MSHSTLFQKTCQYFSKNKFQLPTFYPIIHLKFQTQSSIKFSSFSGDNMLVYIGASKNELYVKLVFDM